MNATEILETIKPGKNYPSYVKVEEKGHPKVEFHLNSFYSGMYCAIHVDGKVAVQTGDHNNKGFCTKLKKDIAKAITRKAAIEFGTIRECQLLTMD